MDLTVCDHDIYFFFRMLCGGFYELCVFIYTALQKFGNALEKWGFGQYWHESFLICDNFALIRDNTNYENIFYYINSLYI